MAEPKAAGFQFHCDLCDEERFGVPSIINSQHQYVVDEDCAVECIVPLILQAKANEYSYPPAWGNVAVAWRNYLHWLPKNFAHHYKARRTEYRTPLSERIYCRRQRRKEDGGLEEQCGAFLGATMGITAQHPSNHIPVGICHDCDKSCLGSCMRCGEVLALESAKEVLRHKCTITPDDDASDFEGLVRGVHYQVCPGEGCNMKVELAEACNALVCLGHACRTSFCAICGLRAAHDSDHWQAGKPCPRWKLPTDRNASFDPVPEPTEPQPSSPWLAAQALWARETGEWRQRPWNHLLVRDARYVDRLMGDLHRFAEDAMMQWDVFDLRELTIDLYELVHSQFVELGRFVPGVELARQRVLDLNDELADDANSTLFRALLMLLHDTLEIIALHRGTGRQLTRDHLMHLLIHHTSNFANLMAIWGSIEEEFMLDYPRIVHVLQRTLDELKWFLGEISERLDEYEHEHDAEPNDPNATDQAEVPVIEDQDLSVYLRAYEDLEATRLDMIQQGIPRYPALAPAIDMFWLQYRSLKVPSLYRDATSTREKYRLMAQFISQHQEIELYREEIWERQFPNVFIEQRKDLWSKTTDGYDELAESFMKLVPWSVISRHFGTWQA